MKQLCLLNPLQEGLEVSYQECAHLMPPSGSSQERLAHTISVRGRLSSSLFMGFQGNVLS